MIYADYAFYTDVYHGSTISSDAFPALAREASAYIDLITFGRATPTDAVRMATCAVADTISAYSDAQFKAIKNAGLKSEAVGSWSASYQDTTETRAEIDAAKRAAAYPYLIFTGLMDRSVGGGCR